LAWLNQGLTRDTVAQARSFFDRALSADPDNVDALYGLALVDVREGEANFVSDAMAAFAAAEAKLNNVLSSVPDHARVHLLLGYVKILTKRVAEGIAGCEHALMLDRNLASAHSAIGLGKTYAGRAEETEAHILEALRLSPRDTRASNLMHTAGYAKNHLAKWEQAVAWFRRSIEANRNNPHAHFQLAIALARLGRLDEARSAVKAGLALNPSFSISRARATWTAASDNPTYLAQFETILEGMRIAGIPES
jgi:tetratricopeptide (TPR) repeat protein